MVKVGNITSGNYGGKISEMGWLNFLFEMVEFWSILKMKISLDSIRGKITKSKLTTKTSCRLYSMTTAKLKNNGLSSRFIYLREFLYSD